MTSGVIGRTPGRLLTEETAAVANPLTALRLPVEETVLALDGVRSSSVLLAPTVHGDGDSRGFIAMLVALARTEKVSAFAGDGANRWPAVHRRDAATLFRLAVESAPAGTRWHAVAEGGVPFREIAGAIGRYLGVPVESRESAHFGLLGPLVALDGPVSSARTRERSGWRPAHPTLVEDIRDGRYLATQAG